MMVIMGHVFSESRKMVDVVESEIMLKGYTIFQPYWDH